MASALLVLFVSILAFTFIDADNTTDYIHQLEQKISDLESHTKATEQKQAAVLASILSRLQSQEEKIQEHTDDLQNFTANLMPTTSTAGSQPVAFEARTTSDKMSTFIKFNNVPFNDGGGYNGRRGTFIAPTTGTYQFWFTVSVSEIHATQPISNAASHDVVALIARRVSAGSSYGGYVGPAHVTSGMHHIDVRVVHGLHVVPLTVGDTVYVKLLTSATVLAGSSFGGVLIG